MRLLLARPLFHVLFKLWLHILADYIADAAVCMAQRFDHVPIQCIMLICRMCHVYAYTAWIRARLRPDGASGVVAQVVIVGDSMLHFLS
jgi:hypothetical protein